ncbi:hypothetical protein O6H91_Y028000 [Diphasiastrum complanatum]|nr:hypothetical protein O6H91_Y028000 [Diphasiastrum complanatum]KAJ7297925.1 hypothetical protein O6H91_Y028000 [Diphasiastrum complanatum]
MAAAAAAAVNMPQLPLRWTDYGSKLGAAGGGSGIGRAKATTNNKNKNLASSSLSIIFNNNEEATSSSNKALKRPYPLMLPLDSSSNKALKQIRAKAVSIDAAVDADTAVLEPVAPAKGASDDTIQQFLKRDYKWGFVSNIESVSIPKGLLEETIRLISAKKQEPECMLQFRVNAYRQWLKMKEPTWSDNHYPRIDFQDMCYYSEPKQKETKQSLDEVDPELLRHFRSWESL